MKRFQAARRYRAAFLNGYHRGMWDANHKRCDARGGLASPGFQRRRALTMVEVLVVIAIIGLLAGLLLPAVQSVRESSRRTKCAGNFRELGHALSGYEARNGRFPPAGRGYSWCSLKNNDGTPNGSVGDSKIYNSNGLVELLPFIDAQPVFDRFDHQVAFSNCGGPTANGGNGWLNTTSTNTVGNPSANAALSRDTTLSVFRCPSDSQQPNGLNNPAGLRGTGSHTNYDFVGLSASAIAAAGATPATAATRSEGSFCNLWRASGVNQQMFGQNSTTTSAHVIDGLSNTLALGETTVHHVGGEGFAWGYRCMGMTGIDVAMINDWNAGTSIAPVFGRVGYSTRPAASMHPGGCHFLIADGVVMFFSENSDVTARRSLARMRDGSVIWAQ